MLLSTLTALCISLEKENSRLEKKKIIHTFLLQHSLNDIILTVNFLTHAIEGKIIVFQLSDIQIIKYMSEYFAISVDEMTQKIKAVGDLGSAFAWYKETQNITSEPLLIDTIINILLDIAFCKGKDSQLEKKLKLFYLWNSLSSLDNCYIIRFLKGALRIGLSEKTIIEVLNDILIENNLILNKNYLFNCYAVCSNLAHITQLVLQGSIDALMAISPMIGTFIQSQSAEVYIQNKNQLNFAVYTYILQPKLDGFRLQAHYNNNEVYLFSRNGLLVNHMFPQTIIDMREYCQKNMINNAIFDGEIIGFNNHTNEYLSFEDIAKRKRKHNIMNNKDLCDLRYVLFDILFYNSKSFLSESYTTRFSHVTNWQDTKNIVTIPTITAHNSIEIQQYYEKSILQKFEGIMIKESTSEYQPGKRTRTWLKYKEVQKDSLEDLIDAVILGYTIAKGSRKNRQHIGSVLVGLYNDKTDMFETLAQVGTGGNAEIWNTIEKNINAYICQEVPINVIINKKHLPDVFIEPQIIISIKADKVTKSKEHTSGLSIRFPRIISVRTDKNKYQTNCPYS
jgi:ATP-dependent DNA ligase I